jgi:3',5'-cyclic AMP phosphodiesterase CpdA
MIYEFGDPALIDKVVIEPYSGTLDNGTTLAPVLGNHDVRMGAGDEIMTALGARQRWYSAADERLLLVVLDSTRPNDSEQLEFLDKTLASANSDWIVVALHHPPFSAGYHGSDSAIQDMFVPIFEEHGVDVVFAGHDHDYQRSRPINGITYVVTGAGAKLRPTGSLAFTVVSASVPHFVSLDVRPGSLTVEAIAASGVIDRFELTK